jgi:hypothetical protein
MKTAASAAVGGTGSMRGVMQAIDDFSASTALPLSLHEKPCQAGNEKPEIASLSTVA